jgi:alpha-L-fucosidase
LNRRTFLHDSALGVGAAAFAGSRNALAIPLPAASGHLAAPTTDQLRWQQMEFGMFVHIAPNTWQNREYDDLSTPLNEINPDIDTDNWAQCAVNLGARYIVFVAKHAGGFCWWQTKTTKYSVSHIPWENGHGDVLRNLRKSCDKFGLKLGVYVSPRDGYHHASTGGVCKTPEEQRAYNAIYREQLTEVLSRYGAMVEIWFDGSNVVPVSDILARYAPHAAIFQGPEATIRWVGNENGFAPYPCWEALPLADASTGVATSSSSTPHGNVWMPIEADVSIRRPKWFWSTTDLKDLMSLDDLIEVYYRSIGRGVQLLLNVPPDTTGHIDPHDFARAKEFGDEIRRRFDRPVGDTEGSGHAVTLRFAQPRRVDHAILQEDCRYGQRVETYRIDGFADGKWKTLATGSTIGFKRIQPLTPATVHALRVVVTSALETPHHLRLAAYDTHAAPPASWNASSYIWAPTPAGSWKGSSFHVDLTPQIKQAAQYLVRFTPQRGRVTALRDVQILFNGAPEPKLVKHIPDSPNALLIDVTGIGLKIELKGTVEGATQGSILLQQE